MIYNSLTESVGATVGKISFAGDRRHRPYKFQEGSPANVLKIDHVLCDHHERVIRRAVRRFCLTNLGDENRFMAHAGAAFETSRSDLGKGEPPLPRFHPLVEGNLSVQAISWVIDQSKHKGNTFVVLLMIANHAKSDGSGAWPSIHTIAKESRLSDRTVQRCIKRLSLHWKKIWPPELLVRTGKGPYGSNLYDIPGVKLSPPGDKTGIPPVSDTVTTPVSQLSHPIRHLTVLKDKRTGLLYRITSERGREYLTAEETEEANAQMQHSFQ